jgi:hypothetical protein
MPLETDPLLLQPSNAPHDKSSNYYFLNKATSNASEREGQVVTEMEGIPEGTTEDEFAPRQLPAVCFEMGCASCCIFS